MAVYGCAEYVRDTRRCTGHHISAAARPHADSDTFVDCGGNDKQIQQPRAVPFFFFISVHAYSFHGTVL